ncbi:hypothetical protein [Streptomyces thermolilacinus]|uniref:Uncharacterized protein n=1 Tax=Streptomyces thermolilacinus SPC6 TaxID=1306406 RepID=A0A1D3DTZ3_9ACTN|nr:hypothetical protein [Streptomyces thermolilacinus]OEJ95800.1 hypothetical protein J116_016275 [Streptomyces thermolilacinus SPC6]
MSAFASDPALDEVHDAAGHGTKVDVALHLHDGTVRLSILSAQEILLTADDADQVAQALQRAAEQARRITATRAPDRPTGT